ncbi:MAG TPA: thioesterase family protein [Solirubrobacteraceae bacterium]|nr:thioesterase family protein [Solirubrobacteraceae bacterium]
MTARVHEKRIELRWRDFDAFGHVNNSVYLDYLEEVRDEWLDETIGKHGSSWDFVLVRVAIDFRRELLVDRDRRVLLSCCLAGTGRSSVRTREQVRTPEGELVAEAESVLVARNRGETQSRPLTPAEVAAFGVPEDTPNA